MLAHVLSASVLGLEPVVVTVEASFTSGLPSLTVVGLPQNAVREGRERVIAALRHIGIALPPRRITINLAPADVRKEGSGLDLALAVALMVGAGVVPLEAIKGTGFLGELGLDGTVRPVRGVLSRVAGLAEAGCDRVVVPEENACEARAVGGPVVFSLPDLETLRGWLVGERSWGQCVSGAVAVGGERVEAGTTFPSGNGALRDTAADLRDVQGQEAARRALEIAAAGGHNIVFVGPPGSGKTLLASRLPGILPPFGRKEALEASRIHSVSGLLGRGEGLLRARPFRAPHHSISPAGLAGGGQPIRPGEISLAHQGVLFLDELPEYRRSVLELLREPLESGTILLGRAQGNVRFPARFLLVAAMNPCPCGFHGTLGERCSCPPALIERYRSRVSGPLLDRIDLHVPVQPVPLDRLTSHQDGESTEAVAGRVMEARAHGAARNGGAPNALLSPRSLRTCARIDSEAIGLFQRAQTRMSLSARGFHRTLRVARTIADLAGREAVRSGDVAEALHYRELDRPVV